MSADIVRLGEMNAVLSEGNRLRIICLLKDGELCVCEIWQLLDLPQNLISHHLRSLKDAGLIRSRKDGPRVFYSLNGDSIKRYVADLGKLIN